MRCQSKNCEQPEDQRYLGIGLCWRHWTKACESDNIAAAVLALIPKNAEGRAHLRESADAYQKALDAHARPPRRRRFRIRRKDTPC
jgi:hypothetical protein